MPSTENRCSSTPNQRSEPTPRRPRHATRGSSPRRSRSSGHVHRRATAPAARFELRRRPPFRIATVNFDSTAFFGLAQMRCTSIKMMPRPYAGPCVRNGPSSLRRCFATPEPAGAANRQRPRVSGSRRATSSDRAEEAGSRSRSPGPAHKRGDGVMNGRHVPHASPAEKCDAARSRAMSERGAAPAAPLHPSEGKTTQTPWSLPRAPSSKARAGPVARLRPSAGLAWVGCRREAFLLV